MNEMIKTPGGSARRNPAFPKGRLLDDVAAQEIADLVGERSLARDELIEHLHLIQDHFGHISARHLHALAHLMRLSMAEVYEVATFYDHFGVVKETSTIPAPVTIRVCDSLSCMMAGAESLIADLEAGVNPQKVRVVRAPCMGGCDVAPAARVGNREVGNANAASLLEMAGSASKNAEIKAHIPDYESFESYRAKDGYEGLRSIRTGGFSFEEITKTLERSGLRGLGGAGFPSNKKWQFVRDYEGPRLMTINGDEGEPGTFKDRYYLEREPHAMLEGALIAAHAVEAERIYLYMRDEYPAIIEILRREIDALEAAGLVENGYLVLRRGAGAYICGEESAMIESLEGKRGLPRHRPPYIAEVGLFGKPTLNHNVETLHWIPKILANGPEWFANQGKEGHPGPRSWSVSGRVKEPGVKLAPAGITVRELIDDYCGGMEEGHTFKAYYPGGASGGVLPASMDDIPLDFGGRLAEEDSFVGSHAVVILSDKDDVKGCVINTLKFFEHESCGQCTPCRSGCQKMVHLLQKDEMDETAIRDLEQVMRDASICGLGQAAPNPVNHLLKHFREDL